MKALIVLFNLKDRSAQEAYEAWANATDIPNVKSLKSIDEFKLFRTEGLFGSNENPPYQYVEVIEVNDMALFGAEAQSEVVQKTIAEFAAFADNPIFMSCEQAG